MLDHIKKFKTAALSATAKDTYVLFTGNLLTAFWGFLFTVIVAKALSISDFGIFSAALNLIIILIAVGDIGVSSGAVNFVSEFYAKKNEIKSNEYIKASFIIRVLVALIILVIVAIFSPQISKSLIATSNYKVGLWAALLPIFLLPDSFFPFILQAKRKFLKATIIDNLFYLGRLSFAYFYYIKHMLTMDIAFWSYAIGFVLTLVLSLTYVNINFLHSRPKLNEYKKLIKFSGWLGVNKIVSTVSGRLDITMLAALAGAGVTGLYSIPARLASFIVVLTGSFSSVLATRLSGFGNKESEKKYIIKSLYAVILITIGVIIWIIFAHPFIKLLFGEKYVPSVYIFQALSLSMIPFIFTVPSVTAIIYAMKKTSYIGIFSFFQIAAIFLLNFVFIPKYGPIGPTLTFGIVNSILLIYSWLIILRYYWGK